MTPQQQAAHRAWPAAPPQPQSDREMVACSMLAAAVKEQHWGIVRRVVDMLGGVSSPNDSAGGQQRENGTGVAIDGRGA